MRFGPARARESFPGSGKVDRAAGPDGEGGAVALFFGWKEAALPLPSLLLSATFPEVGEGWAAPYQARWVPSSVSTI
jgi:hypothetical protein